MSPQHTDRSGKAINNDDGAATPRKRFGAGRRTAAALALVALVASAGIGIQYADAAQAQRPKKDTVQRSLDALVKAGVAPGALASVRDSKGRVTNYTAGVNDPRTRAKVPTDGYVRMASNTKMFTAVAVLQLVDEGKVQLDEPIEMYLPGLVRGKGFDGHTITVRHLLSMTSGLPEYDLPDVSVWGNRYYEPRDMLDSAFAREAHAPAPGGQVQYRNANYIVAGLLVQKVTGRPISEVITNKILKPVGLHETYWPGVGDKTIRRPYAKGYLPDPETMKWVDTTQVDPSIAWAAGQMISTPSDLNKFLVALQYGKLISPATLAEMRDSKVFHPGGEAFPDLVWQYGLGATGYDLSCGGRAWGHGGDIDGYSSRSAITADGRAVTIVVTAGSSPVPDGVFQVLDAFDAALCAGR
ncbi:serine hydrolase domain-containing protein [Verrucosispora sp. WMMD1129]|uniref:serine hydrolase domain-containing protein n=1 Tax=Verrucosispora sp. WMMD1129 TaxID=3016093 RepID=UPI00249A2F79|nr:serine hydrolase domain-containing protein [Verrucosispora sp. WMMD1129]WFE47775.1 serine hydrolase [Verrucosispora sp. WMMD1129]